MQEPPYARERLEKAEEHTVATVAHRRIAPVLGVEAEEELDVPQCVGLGTVHITEEKVAKLDGESSGKEESCIRDQKPGASAPVKQGRGKTKQDCRDPNEDDGPVYVPLCRSASC